MCISLGLLEVLILVNVNLFLLLHLTGVYIVIVIHVHGCILVFIDVFHCNFQGHFYLKCANFDIHVCFHLFLVNMKMSVSMHRSSVLIAHFVLL